MNKFLFVLLISGCTESALPDINCMAAFFDKKANATVKCPHREHRIYIEDDKVLCLCKEQYKKEEEDK
jgi:hypothetical protein